ncbi:hypothetical protein I8Y06_000088 [Photobacterium damselae]|nr:hypothetical protein [Photobacterium damselae]
MQQNNIKIITSFDDIIALMDEQSSKLKDKSRETEWQRHILRRIPVYAGAVMIFFLICVLTKVMKIFELKDLGIWLGSLNQFMSFGLGTSLLILFFMIMIGFYIYDARRVEKWKKATISFALQFSVVIVFLWTINIENKTAAIFFGLVFFGTLTLTAILVDRTLGYTRRNERYNFFSKRAEAIATKYTSLKAMPNSSFTEQHLNECLAFFEQIYLSKYNDTVTDSFYLLSQIEKKVAG